MRQWFKTIFPAAFMVLGVFLVVHLSAESRQPGSREKVIAVAADNEPASATREELLPEKESSREPVEEDELAEEFLLEPEFDEELPGTGAKEKPAPSPEVEDKESWEEEAEFWEEESEEKIEPLEKIESALREGARIPGILSNLEDCKRAAIINDMRIQVAIKEIRYSRYKVLEAERDFLPKVQMNWERKDGISEEDQKEESFDSMKYGLEGNQTIFHGGKLVYTLKQAKIDLKVAQKKFLQAHQEVIFKVEKAYYELVKAQLVFEIQADMSKVAESGLSFSREAYQAGLNSYSEFLNIQSQTDQTYYHLLAAQQDISLAELELRTACNIDSAIGIQIDAVLTFMDFDFNYSLDECLELAFKNRPDLALNELTSLSNLYGIRLAKAEGMPKIEIIGTVGKNGENKKGERMELTDEWALKFQASWTLGANSAEYIWEKEETSPTEFGEQNNIKSSTTQKATLQIFDKLENFSKLAEARVEMASSDADFVELKGKIAGEVEEHYFDYQKAMTMVTASLSKIKFREKELEINRARQMMDEIPLSQVLNSELQLGEARVNYVEALGDYYTAIAGLFKAMGLAR